MPTLWSFLPLTDLSYQILLAVAGGPQHGYGILRIITNRTGGRLEPNTGTLYTAVRRLKRDGLIEPVPGDAPRGRQGRSYRLTELGREVLMAESKRLAELLTEARDLNLIGDEPRAAGGQLD